MLKIFYRLYFIQFNSPRLDDLYKRSIVRAANYLLEFYYNVTGLVTRRRKLLNTEKPKLVVSLTTYPARIEKIWIVVETLLDQTVKPDKILLWLYIGEFKSKECLPTKLQALEERGLEIRFCEENLYPHKKYFYTMKEYPGAKVITVDDDVIYPAVLIEDLLNYNQMFSESIVCTVSREILMENGAIKKYRDWKYTLESTEPDFKHQMIGAGGVMYPPGVLDEELFNVENIKRFSLKTDDLWLKVMSLRKGTKVACLSGEYPRLFIPLIRKRDEPLMKKNLGENQNDKNLSALLEQYNIDLSEFMK
ncbi:MAG: hypothetical protein JJU46_14795 [Balneolaceae bacterium]|nr:hypothetical protein [Balneolaceae bacterium]MCH8549212.1 hypothetical protein [Balneolaceae bacterium]